MNNALIHVIGAGCFIVMSTLHSGWAEEDASQNKQESTSSSSTESKQTSSPTTKPLKEFTPSEEISVDKPVAFPVDI